MNIFKKWIRDFVDYQKADFSSTEPVHRLSRRDGRFYFNSCAGVLSFKPKNENEVSRFRDKWVNRFEYIKTLPEPERRKMLFNFYNDIRSQEKIRYRANFRTRIKGKLCSLNPLL